MLVVDCRRQRVGKGLAHDRVLGISAVVIPPGETRVQAEVLAAPAAVDASAVGFAQPRHADSIAQAKTPRVRTERIDDADDLMSRNGSALLGRKVALAEVKVGPADSARDDSHEDLARAGNRFGPLGETQGLRFNRAGGWEGERTHRLTLSG